MLLLGFGGASPVVQGGAAAQDQEKVPARYSDPSSGKQMFRDHCAACHGMEGRGDGPVARFLRTPLADLGAFGPGSTRLPRRYAWARMAEYTGRLTCRRMRLREASYCRSPCSHVEPLLANSVWPLRSRPNSLLIAATLCLRRALSHLFMTVLVAGHYRVLFSLAISNARMLSQLVSTLSAANLFRSIALVWHRGVQ